MDPQEHQARFSVASCHLLELGDCENTAEWMIRKCLYSLDVLASAAQSGI